LKKTYFEILISFLAGASWALVIFGAINLFLAFLPFGFLLALLAGFIGSLFGLFLVLIVEIASLQVKKFEELKHQTKLLEKMTKKNDGVPNN
jgi:hypothetical protein